MPPATTLHIFPKRRFFPLSSRFVARFTRPPLRLFGSTNPVPFRSSKEPNINPFAVLGLPNTATKAQAKARYYEIAKRCHPDVNPSVDGGGGGGGSRNTKRKTNSPSFLAAKNAYETIVQGTWRPPDDVQDFSSSHYSPSDNKTSDGNNDRSAYWFRSTTRWSDAGPEARRRFVNETFDEHPKSRVRPDGDTKDVGPPILDDELPWWKTFLYALRNREGWSWSVLGFGTFTVFAMIVPVVPEKPSPEVLKGRTGHWVIAPRAFPWSYVPRCARHYREDGSTN